MPNAQIAGTVPLELCASCAFAGNGLACYAAARACGEARRDAFAIGALMNARA